MSQDQDHTVSQSTSANRTSPRDQEQDVEGYLGALALFGIAVAAGATVEVGSRIYDHYNYPLLEGIRPPQNPD